MAGFRVCAGLAGLLCLFSGVACIAEQEQLIHTTRIELAQKNRLIEVLRAEARQAEALVDSERLAIGVLNRVRDKGEM